MLTAFLGVAGFLFGIIQYLNANRAQLELDTRSPLWDTQLALYIDAAEAASTIATTEDADRRKQAEEKFWILYWGPLAAVEDVGMIHAPSGSSVEGAKKKTLTVETAMVRFGDAIKVPDTSPEELQELSLQLAHAVRDSIAPAFQLGAKPSENLRPKPPAN